MNRPPKSNLEDGPTRVALDTAHATLLTVLTLFERDSPDWCYVEQAVLTVERILQHKNPPICELNDCILFELWR
jgi:hypothetical protein